jgi:DNA-binding CsgD family transcriptional regulator
MKSVPTWDVAALVKCLACATDPSRSLSLDVRRRRLLDALAQFIEADAWIWIGGPWPSAGEVTTLRTLDGGWRDDRERSQTLEELGQPKFQALLDAALRQSAGDDGADCSEEPSHNAQALSSQDRGGLPLSRFSGSLTAACPAPEATNCLVGLFRRNGAAPFSERDCTIAKLIVQNVPWLHLTHIDVAEVDASLSPREREVIRLLLEGFARKEVAGALNLSAHTVADYVKGIYKKFGVKSRAELLSKYISPDAVRKS